MQVATLFLAAICVIAIDQSAKSLALRKLHDGRVITFGFVAIRTVLNRQAGWPICRSDSALVALWLGELVLFALLVQFGAVFEDAVGPSTALGGGGGNLLDRILNDGVTE
jgi:lipoprotein signal peptidase